MAFDSDPASWIASFDCATDTISFDRTDLTEPLADAEASATTGDFREVMWALLRHTQTYIDNLATANKPTKFTISSVQTQDGDSLINTFTVVCTNSIVSQTLEAE